MRVLFDPEPRQAEEMFSPADHTRFLAGFEVTVYEGEDRQDWYTAHLPTTDVLISQQPMGRDRLDSAPHLRAIFNVETNFLPNIDYEACFARGIHVLAPSSVFAGPVAEIGLGMALSLARGIHTAHADFTASKERYGLAGNEQAELLSGADIGFIGFGDLGVALHRLLAGFQATLRVYDPWLPDGYLDRAGVVPASLNEVLETSRVVFVVASITADNQCLIGARELERMQDGAMLVLLSRAAIVDFDAVRAAAASRRIRFATDVFPEEPLAVDHPIRSTPGTLLSAHRAGALAGALRQIGALVLEDLDLISRNLPPVSCKRAQRETVARMRSMPVEMS